MLKNNNFLLKAENLCKAFGGIIAVNNFSFSIEEEKIVALVGPNGAGKTTLFNLITGFIPADSGRIYLGSKEILGLPPYKINQLGIARSFQDLRILYQIAVIENVLLACPHQSGENIFNTFFKRKKVKTEENTNYEAVSNLLELFGLKGYKHELAESLSYGQQKLLTLACCLSTDANILLLDEPVSGLHPDLLQRIHSLLITLKEKGKTILFIEHNIEFVLDLADQVLFMDEGKLIAQGAPNEILFDSKIIEAYLD